MAVTGWFSLPNGVHIPIMDGQNKAKAFSNFIKNKVKEKRDRYYQIYENMKDKGLSEEDAQTEAEMSVGYKGKRNVKGYSTDPYNRVKKAADAADETYKIFNKRVKNANDRLNEFREERRSRLNNLDEELYKKHPNYLKSELEYRKYHGERDMARRKADYEEARLRGIADNESALRDLESGYAYMDELNKNYTGYKLKANKETPTKRTIKGVHTNKVDWNGKNQEVEVHFWRGNPQLKNGGYNTTRNYTARTENGLMNQIRKSDRGGYGSMVYQSYNPKPKKYKVADTDRQKVVKNLSEKSTKLDRQMSTASGKEYDRLAKEYEKNQRKLNAIGGKYIVGRKKKK